MLHHGDWYLFWLAWKSILRNSGRSFFIGLSVSLAVMVTIWIMAFFGGLNKQIETAVVNANTGHFQIQDPKFAKSSDSTGPLVYSQKEAHLLSGTVKAISPELVLDGNVTTPEGGTGLNLIGIDPASHEKAFTLAQTVKTGEFLTSDDAGKVVIGKELAAVHKFRIGDKLILNYQDQTGSLRSEILRVKGIYDYGSRDFQKGFIYTNQRTWQKLFLNTDSDKTMYNRLVLITSDLSPEIALRKIAKDIGGELKTWKNLNPEMAVVLDFQDGIVKFFFIIIGLTITITILTPVRMLWQERFKEIKMMGVIGVPSTAFWKIGIFEVVQMSFLSGLFSFVVMGMMLVIQSYSGIDIRFLNHGNPIERAGINLPQIIFPVISVTLVFSTLIFVSLVLGVSYFWSIHRTLKTLEVSA